MGLLDPLFDTLGEFVEAVDGTLDAIGNPQVGGNSLTAVVANIFEELTPADELGEAGVQLIEEFVMAEMTTRDGTGIELDPENVQDIVNETEGGATAVLVAAGLSASALEAASLGQVDKHTEYITQALAGLGIDDSTGRELDARVQEGVMPALEAKVGKEHRAKFADISDAVEYLLRNKEGDSLWLQGTNIPGDAYDKVASNNPVNPNNALEEWGIRDDQLDILEEVALNAMEFEELIETPAELGLIVPDEVLDEELDRAGYAESTKEFLRQVNSQISKSARAYQELLVTEELIGSLDTLVKSGALVPSQALGFIPDGVPVDEDELADRFSILAELPPGVPSASDFEGAFARGYLSRQEFERQLSTTDYEVEEYPGVFRAQVLDELDGDLQESVALGLVSETEYSNLCSFVGLDQDATDQLLSGKSLGDITEKRLKEQTSPAERSVGAIQGIGESRSTSLETVGIETLADLAQADAATVAETAQVSPETAENWINLARQASQ